MNEFEYVLVTTITTKQGGKYSFSTTHNSEREAFNKKTQHRFTIEGNHNSPFYDNDFFITKWFMVRKSEIEGVEFEVGRLMKKHLGESFRK